VVAKPEITRFFQKSGMPVILPERQNSHSGRSIPANGDFATIMARLSSVVRLNWIEQVSTSR
jgi:hypothetical protein